MVDWFKQLFSGEWKTVARSETEFEMGGILGSSGKRNGITVIQKHSETGNLRGYIVTPSGERHYLGNEMVNYIWDTEIEGKIPS